MISIVNPSRGVAVKCSATGGERVAADSVKPLRRRRVRVLIAEDNAAVRESLKKVLLQAGCAVVLAADGSEALERFHNERVQLMVLDLGLPIQSGWDVFERITNENPTLPIIIITGQTNQIWLAAAAGAGALLEKPVDPAELLHAMNEVLAEPKKVRLRRICGHTQKVRYFPSRSAQFLKRIQEHCERPLRLADPDDKTIW